MLVIAAPGAGPGRQVWHTVTVELARVDGRWLVDGGVSHSGPTPALPVEVALDEAATLSERLAWERLSVGVR